MIYWLLPAYNEAENLGPLLRKIDQVMKGSGRKYRIIVVDDGSPDQTAEVAQALVQTLPITLIRHEVNQGLPAVLRTGITHVTGIADDHDAVIALDADNTHEPSVALDMLPMLENGYDVVIASRYQPGGQEIGLSLSRKILSKVCNIVLQVFFPMPGIKDYTCGYRLYRAGVLKALLNQYGDRLIESTTFSCTAELLLKLRKTGVKAAEVPLVLRYDQKEGASKMRVVATTLDYFRLCLRMLSRS